MICLAWAVILGGNLLIPSETAYGLTESSTAYYDTHIKVSDLGHYDFEVEAHEIPSNEILPIIDKSYFPITVSHFQSEIDNTVPSAIYKSKPVSKVDVVFAFGETDKSDAMQKYIPSFESRLQSAGNFIDAHVEKVETSTISSNDAGAAEIFNKWTNYPDSSGQWTFNPSDNSMGSTRNVSWTGFWNSKAQDTTDVVIEYKSKEVLREVDKAPIPYPNIRCHPDPMGWTFRMTQKNGLYSYYVFSIYAYQGVAILARINDTPDPNRATNGVVTGWTSTIPNIVGKKSGYVTQLAYTNIDYNPIKEHSVKIECKGTNIKVIYDGKKLFDYTDASSDALLKGGYGPFTYSMPNGNFYDIVITTGSTKSLGEAISDVSWRDNSTRFVVYAEDTIPEYMKTTDNKDYQYTITKLLNSNAYLINLGTSLNQATLEQLVKFISTPTEQKGTFILNNSTTQSMNDACDWIIEKVRNLSKPEDWILVNTEVIWETEYNDQEHDLPLNFGEHDGTKNSDNSDILLGESWGVGLTHLYKNEKIFAEKWRYRHFNNYFDNSTIRESYHNTWIEDPVTIFPNLGLYRINYKRRDNPLYPDVNLTHSFDSYRYWSENYDRIE